MPTAIMGIPPEETEAFKTDIGYRLSVADAMNEVLEHDDIDEVILTYSVDEDLSGNSDLEAGLSEEGFDFAMNPGTVADYLRSQGIGEDLIEYVMSFSNNQVHGKLANAIRKAPKELGHAMTLMELKKIGEPLRPKELTPLEIALYEAVKTEKGLTAWLGREIRLLKKEYGAEIENADIIQFLYPLQSINDWYIANDRPSGMERLSFEEAHKQAVAWERAQAGSGEGMYYGPVDPQNILYLDPKTGYSVQLVSTLDDLKVEGSTSKMNHCVARYWDEDFHGYGTVQTGGVKILSLRDASNHPHVTVELNNVNAKKIGSVGDWRIQQIKGAANSVPKPEYRKILKRYLMTIPGIRYVGSNQADNRTRGFRSLAIASAVGMDRWKYVAGDYEGAANHGRPMDLADEEIAAIIVDHAKNITAVLQHAKRYPRRAKKGDSVSRFESRTVGLDVRTQAPDEYGIMMVTEKREETKLSASTFGGDLRVFLGDVSLVEERDRQLTPVLKEAIDIFVDVIVEVDKVESKMRDQWRKATSEYLKKQQATLAELKKIGPDNLGPEHFKKGLLKSFLESQNRPEGMPDPSYSNQVYRLEKNIERTGYALGDPHNTESISWNIVHFTPFSIDSLSACAQKMHNERISPKAGNPRGRWSRENALRYFAITVFERINGCPLFAEDE